MIPAPLPLRFETPRARCVCGVELSPADALAGRCQDCREVQPERPVLLSGWPRSIA